MLKGTALGRFTLEGKERGELQLSPSTVLICKDKMLVVSSGRRSWTLFAMSDKDMRAWTQAIQRAVDMARAQESAP